MDEERLEEKEMEFNLFLEPMIEELNDTGIIDGEQWKSFYKSLLEHESAR